MNGRPLMWVLSQTSLVMASLVLAFLLPSSAQAALVEPCGLAAPSASGYFFTNYESVEYTPEGYLIHHFRNQSRFSDGRGFVLRWSYVSDECQTQATTPFTGVSLPAGVIDWSVRFTSPTHFEVWNDTNNTVVTQYTISPAYPDYTRITFRGSIDGGASFVQTRTLKMYAPGVPPEFPDTAEKAVVCADITASGYYFDSYEHAEYVDGLLRLHLRLKTPFNDGRTFRTKTLTAGEPCTVSLPAYLSAVDTTFTPLVRYYSFRMTSPTHWVLWDDEHNVAFTCANCQGDISEGSTYVSWYGTVDVNASTIRTTPSAPSLTPPCCSSVLFLPGFQASKLYEQTAGGESQRWLPGPLQSSVESLRMNPDGTPQQELYTKSDAAIKSVTLPIVGTEVLSIYKTFLAELAGMQSDGTISGWKAFPYDWRMNVEDIVEMGVQYDDGLHTLVDEVTALAATSKTKKITIVGHSNGGLVAKALMIKLESLGKSNLIDRVIFVGSPQLGTPKAIASLLHGDEQDVPQGAGALMLSKSNARALAEYMPGAFGLLPSAEYYARVADPVVDLSDADKLRSETGIQPIVDTYTEAQQFMTGNGLRDTPAQTDTENPNTLSQLLLAQAGVTHSRLDTWTPPLGVDVVQIAGWGLDTVKGIKYWDEAKTICPTLFTCATATSTRHTVVMTEDGDQTVVSASATELTSSKFYINLHEENKASEKNNSHVNLTESGSFQDLFAKLVNQDDLSTPIQFITSVIPNTNITGGRLRLRVMSPADISAKNNLGKVTGLFPNSIAGSDFLYKKEEISNSYYDEYGETKYLGLPEGQYDFSMQGTDTGHFTLEVERVTGDTSTSITSLVDIPVTENTKVNFSTDGNSNLSEVHIDKNGDGVTDYTIEPQVNGEVVLPKTPITVTAQNKAIQLGATLPTSTYLLSGFVAGETLDTSDITGTPECTTTATASSPVGVYPITCTAGTLISDYYKFENFVAGTLTITYPWSGFQQPIDDPAAIVGISPSIFKAGSTIPVKFKLKDANGNIVQATVLPQWLAPTRGAALTGAVDEPVYSDPATTGNNYRWDSTSQQYIYNWKTVKTDAGYWYKIYAKLDDGTIKSVVVGLR